VIDLVERESHAGALGDWRGFVRESPLLVLGLAFAGGLAVASASRSHRKTRAPRREREMAPAGEQVPDDDSSAGDTAEEGRLQEVWERLRATLIDVAADEVASYLDEVLPAAESASVRRRGRGIPKR
jgi:hypothetical protein